MHHRILLITAFGLLCSSVQAQYANIDGKFRSHSTTLNLIPLDKHSGVIAATTTVVQGACSGTVAGVGRISGDELKFSPYVKTDKNGACIVTVLFDEKRNAAKVTADGCMAQSGASCGWEGDTLKRVK